MRLLHTADWHLGRSLEGRSRLEEQQAFLDELVDIVRIEKIDAVLMAGDVFDTVNPPAAAEQMFYNSIARLSEKGARPFIAIAGNHDHPDRLSASFPLAKELGITLVGQPALEIVSCGIHSTGEQLEVICLPYPSESRLKAVLSDSQEEEDVRFEYDRWVNRFFQETSRLFNPAHVNIAMSHLYVAGGKESDSERPVHIGGAYTVAADTLPGSAQYVALGHLHRPQTIKRAKTAARYSGSPLSYSFSESGQTKSVTIVDASPGKMPEISEIPLSSGKPLITWEAKGGVEEVFKLLGEGLYQNTWIDLSIHVTDAIAMEEIQRIRQAHNGIIHIKPIFTASQETVEIAKRASKLPADELFKSFYTRQTAGAEPDAELVSLFLDLLQDEEEEGETAQ